MQVQDIRVFVPAKDFDTSLAFYQALGFVLSPANNDLVLMEYGNCALFLQRFYQQAFAENLMLQICVDDLSHLYHLAQHASETFGCKITPIDHEAWGDVFYLWGPSGELLHITQLKSS